MLQTFSGRSAELFVFFPLKYEQLNRLCFLLLQNFVNHVSQDKISCSLHSLCYYFVIMMIIIHISIPPYVITSEIMELITDYNL